MLVARACGLEKELCRVPLTVEPRGSSLVSAGVLLLLGLVSVLLGVWLARFEPGTARWAWTPLVLGAGWLLGVLSILAGSRLGSPEIAPAAAPFAALANWDGNWYLDIARDGYANPRSFAFSPLYPLVLRGLLGLAVPVRLSAALLNGMFFALTAAALRRLYPRRDHALLLFAFLPFSFFFGAVYTEPLLLALAAGALLATLEGEGLAAAALGGLAALTRVTGISTALFAFAALAPRRWRTAALAAAGPVAGLSAWMLWLRFRSGDALSFLHAQGSFGRTVGFDPSLLLDRLVESVSTGGALGRWEVGSLCAVLVGAAGLLWRRRWAEGLYSAAVVLLPLLTQSPTSLNRYALLAFPALVFLGERVSPRVTGFLLVGEAALIVLWATRFGRSVFVG